MNRVSTNDLFVFFQIGVILLPQHPSPPETEFSTINVRAASPRVALKSQTATQSIKTEVEQSDPSG
ncbi:hypothetical protein NSTC731_03738 [Nostoc sp. DSM 114167]|jgi:hypothetical protein